MAKHLPAVIAAIKSTYENNKEVIESNENTSELIQLLEQDSPQFIDIVRHLYALRNQTTNATITKLTRIIFCAGHKYPLSYLAKPEASLNQYELQQIEQSYQLFEACGNQDNKFETLLVFILSLYNIDDCQIVTMDQTAENTQKFQQGIIKILRLANTPASRDHEDKNEYSYLLRIMIYADATATIDFLDCFCKKDGCYQTTVEQFFQNERIIEPLCTEFLSQFKSITSKHGRLLLAKHQLLSQLHSIQNIEVDEPFADIFAQCSGYQIKQAIANIQNHPASNRNTELLSAIIARYQSLWPENANPILENNVDNLALLVRYFYLIDVVFNPIRNFMNFTAPIPNTLPADKTSTVSQVLCLHNMDCPVTRAPLLLTEDTPLVTERKYIKTAQTYVITAIDVIEELIQIMDSLNAKIQLQNQLLKKCIDYFHALLDAIRWNDGSTSQETYEGYIRNLLEAMMPLLKSNKTQELATDHSELPSDALKTIYKSLVSKLPLMQLTSPFIDNLVNIFDCYQDLTIWSLLKKFKQNETRSDTVQKLLAHLKVSPNSTPQMQVNYAQVLYHAHKYHSYVLTRDDLSQILIFCPELRQQLRDDFKDDSKQTGRLVYLSYMIQTFYGEDLEADTEFKEIADALSKQTTLAAKYYGQHRPTLFKLTQRSTFLSFVGKQQLADEKFSDVDNIQTFRQMMLDVLREDIPLSAELISYDLVSECPTGRERTPTDFMTREFLGETASTTMLWALVIMRHYALEDENPDNEFIQACEHNIVALLHESMATRFKPSPYMDLPGYLDAHLAECLVNLSDNERAHIPNTEELITGHYQRAFTRGYQTRQLANPAHFPRYIDVLTKEVSLSHWQMLQALFAECIRADEQASFDNEIYAKLIIYYNTLRSQHPQHQRLHDIEAQLDQLGAAPYQTSESSAPLGHCRLRFYLALICMNIYCDTILDEILAIRTITDETQQRVILIDILQQLVENYERFNFDATKVSQSLGKLFKAIQRSIKQASVTQQRVLLRLFTQLASQITLPHIMLNWLTNIDGLSEFNDFKANRALPQPSADFSQLFANPDIDAANIQQLHSYNITDMLILMHYSPSLVQHLYPEESASGLEHIKLEGAGQTQGTDDSTSESKKEDCGDADATTPLQADYQAVRERFIAELCATRPEGYEHGIKAALLSPVGNENTHYHFDYHQVLNWLIACIDGQDSEICTFILRIPAFQIEKVINTILHHLISTMFNKLQKGHGGEKGEYLKDKQDFAPYWEIANQLLSAGADINLHREERHNDKSVPYVCLLFLAIYLRDTDKIAELLTRGAMPYILPTKDRENLVREQFYFAITTAYKPSVYDSPTQLTATFTTILTLLLTHGAPIGTEVRDFKCYRYSTTSTVTIKIFDFFGGQIEYVAEDIRACGDKLHAISNLHDLLESGQNKISVGANDGLSLQILLSSPHKNLVTVAILSWLTGANAVAEHNYHKHFATVTIYQHSDTTVYNTAATTGNEYRDALRWLVTLLCLSIRQGVEFTSADVYFHIAKNLRAEQCNTEIVNVNTYGIYCCDKALALLQNAGTASNQALIQSIEILRQQFINECMDEVLVRANNNLSEHKPQQANLNFIIQKMQHIREHCGDDNRTYVTCIGCLLATRDTHSELEAKAKQAMFSFLNTATPFTTILTDLLRELALLDESGLPSDKDIKGKAKQAFCQYLTEINTSSKAEAQQERRRIEPEQR